jgi:hypothetical protein
MEPVPDRLAPALSHITSLYGQYITQRQNVVNYYLVGVGLLAVAFSGALDKGQRAVAIAVCVLGVVASVGAYFQDQRLLKAIMELAEAAIEDLQDVLAAQIRVGPAMDSLRLQRHVKRRRPDKFKRRGPIIRVIYLVVGALFLIGAVLAMR